MFDAKFELEKTCELPLYVLLVSKLKYFNKRNLSQPVLNSQSFFKNWGSKENS